MFGSVILFILSVLAVVAGFRICEAAQSAVHEIEGALCFVVAALLLASAVLCSNDAKLSRVLVALCNLRDDSDQREKKRHDVAEERWEILITSLNRLETSLNGELRERPARDASIDYAKAVDYLKTKCSQCGRMVQVKQEWASKIGKCPICGGAIRFDTATSGVT